MHDVIDIPTDFARAYVFDMDGTIYLGEHLLPGARRMIEELRRREIPVRFLSNNPTKDPDQYVDKLTRLGLPTAIEDISNTVVTTTRWLVNNHPDAKVFAIAEEPLKRSLREAGIELCEETQTNPDRFCPFPGGRGEPDCAAVTAAIEACTGQQCKVSLGKPSPVMLTEALSGLDVDPTDCVMVGDRLQTDIQMALDTGMKSACVLTGEATAAPTS